MRVESEEYIRTVGCMGVPLRENVWATRYNKRNEVISLS